MKYVGRAALGVGGLLLIGGALVFTTGFLLPALFAAMAEIPWVASGILFVGFLVGLYRIPRRGWSPEGSLLLMGTVLLGTLLDGVGNAFFNAPYEALFLEPGHRLQGTAHVESIGGETHVSGAVTVVDPTGRYVSTPNWFLLGVYRALVYFAFYSVLLTISGFFPNRRHAAKVTAGESLA